MPGLLLRRLLLVPPLVLAWTGLAASARACPFCSAQGTTLTGEVNQASMVLFGTLANAQLGAGGVGGTTDLNIEAVIKKNDILGDKKVVTLPRYVPSMGKDNKFLVFCDVFKGKIDPYRGVPLKEGSSLVKYLQGAIAVKDKPIVARLKFFFKYLDDPDLEVSNDAYKEFAYASYNDYREMAHHLPAARIAKWLQDPDTPSYRFGLYASMLGHCGTAKDAEMLRKMLDDPQKRITSGMDGVLAGYIMLEPKQGWEYLRGLLADAKKEFMVRYAGLRAVSFFWDSRPDLVTPKQMVDAVCLLLDQSDIADLAIEYLRKWHRWEVSDRVLELYGKKSHDVPIIRRTILRYALCCPGPKAAALVAEARKKDAETVSDVEELLKAENASPAPAPNKTAANK